MSRLVSVWGTCDGTDILFSEVGEDVWETTVPADLQDGEYVVEIWGQAQSGFILYTTAILYLTDSRCVRLKLMPEGYYVKIGSPEYRVVLHTADYECREVVNLCVNVKAISTVTAVIQNRTC